MKNEGRKVRLGPLPAIRPRVLLVIPTANIIHRQILTASCAMRTSTALGSST
jgi:hypothetical protein